MRIRSSAFVSVAFSFALAALAGCGATQRPDGKAGMLETGFPAPDVAGVDQSGQTHRLSSERGHPVIVYFYPKDETPGCTKEACAFRDAWKEFVDAGVAIVGVSSDDQASHAAFAKAHQLTFPIIADPDHVWAKAFGVPMTLGMTKRVTFLLGANGEIAKLYDDVDPVGHPKQVLADALRLVVKAPAGP